MRRGEVYFEMCIRDRGKAGFHQGCGLFCALKAEGRQEKKGECTVSFRSDTGYGPVSYTHLDVYKRQVHINMD